MQTGHAGPLRDEAARHVAIVDHSPEHAQEEEAVSVVAAFKAADLPIDVERRAVQRR